MPESTTACVPALAISTCDTSSPTTSSTKARPRRSAMADRQMLPVHTKRMEKGGASADGRLTSTVCGSVRPRAAGDSSQGLPEDHEVEGQRPVLHVAYVDAYGVVPGEIGAAADLPEPREA